MIRTLAHWGFAAALFLLVASPASALIIDTFDTAASATANSGTTSDSQTTASGSFVGTDRRIDADWLSGANDVAGEIDAGGSSLLNINLGADTLGSVSVFWQNLGGLDLTVGSTLNGIAFEIQFDDLPADITIQVFDGTFFGQSTFGTTGSIFTPTVEGLQFSSFSGTVDFSSVETIKLIVDANFGGTDIQLGFIESAVVVPEPSTALMMGFGLVGLAAARRRN